MIYLYMIWNAIYAYVISPFLKLQFAWKLVAILALVVLIGLTYYSCRDNPDPVNWEQFDQSQKEYEEAQKNTNKAIEERVKANENVNKATNDVERVRNANYTNTNSSQLTNARCRAYPETCVSGNASR